MLIQVLYIEWGANLQFSLFRSPQSITQPEFDRGLRSKPNRHLAFGTGPHLCLGMQLARLEIKCFFEQLLPRLDSIELAGEANYLAANLVSGPMTLPVKYKLN